MKLPAKTGEKIMLRFKLYLWRIFFLIYNKNHTRIMIKCIKKVGKYMRRVPFENRKNLYIRYIKRIKYIRVQKQKKYNNMLKKIRGWE